MSKLKTRSFAAFALATAVGSIAIGASPPSTEAILENSPVSCFYVLMHAYRQEMNICEMPLDQSREERFSRMSDTMETYIRNNARLDPEAIITNSRGTAERAAASFPARTLDLSNDILGPVESAVQEVPYCESTEFNTLRQAMLDFTTTEAEAELNAQVETGLPLAHGSCW